MKIVPNKITIGYHFESTFLELLYYAQERAGLKPTDTRSERKAKLVACVLDTGVNDALYSFIQRGLKAYLNFLETNPECPLIKVTHTSTAVFGQQITVEYLSMRAD